MCQKHHFSLAGIRYALDFSLGVFSGGDEFEKAAVLTYVTRWHNGSVSPLKSKDLWSVQDFSHICDVLGLSGWLGVIVTE